MTQQMNLQRGLVGHWTLDTQDASSDFRDDFESTSLSSKWETFGSSNGSISVSNNELVIEQTAGGSSSYIGVRTTAEFPVGSSLLVRSKNTSGRHANILGVGEDAQQPFPHDSGGNPAATLYSRADAITATCSVQDESGSTNTFSPTKQDYRSYSILELRRVDSSTVEYYVDGSIQGSHTGLDFGRTKDIYFSADGNTVPNRLVVDWVTIIPSSFYDSSAATASDASVNGQIETGKSSIPPGEYTESNGVSGSFIGTRYQLSNTLTNGFSASAWIKDIGTAGGGSDRFLSMDLSDWWGFRRNGSAGTVEYHFRDSAGKAYLHGENIGTGDWVHVVGVWDHTVPEVRYYLDGVLVNSQSVTNSGFGTGSVTRYLILHDGSESASYNTNQNLQTDCGLSDVRVWERPITESEVNALYQMREQRRHRI